MKQYKNLFIILGIALVLCGTAYNLHLPLMNGREPDVSLKNIEVLALAEEAKECVCVGEITPYDESVCGTYHLVCPSSGNDCPTEKSCGKKVTSSNDGTCTCYL